MTIQQQQLYFDKYLHDYDYSKLFVPANSRARQGWDKFKITNIQFKLVESICQIICSFSHSRVKVLTIKHQTLPAPLGTI